MTASGSAPRTLVGAWELPLLLVAGAALALPDVFSMDAFKTGTLGLLAAAVVLPRLLLGGRDALRDAVTSPGGLLYLAAAAWALPSALDATHHSAVTDRIVDVLLALTAAALGVAARRAGPGVLLRGMCWATLVTAVSALLQAVGADTRFTTGPEEIVALMGNSTRAGALLALGLPAALAALMAADEHEPHWRARLASGALLLGIAALLLTRARGGWLAAAVGLAVTAFVLRAELAARVRTWLLPIVAGAALALVLAPTPGALLQSKLDEGAPVLSAGDTTLNVRLAVWRGTLRMVSDHAAVGAGLGRYRERFPPYRDADEAALPGLAGARTEVDHPHDEYLLAFAEGGLPSGLCLLAFLAWTLLRAGRRPGQTGPKGPCAGALGVLVVGATAALVQDAWTNPGTALPFFAAAGWVWTPNATRPESARARAAVWLAGLAAIAMLFAFALPRVRVQWGLRRFLLAAQVEDVTLANFPLLIRAADADPGDVDAQRILSTYGSILEEFHPRADAAVSAAVRRARGRIDDLAPHVP